MKLSSLESLAHPTADDQPLLGPVLLRAIERVHRWATGRLWPSCARSTTAPLLISASAGAIFTRSLRGPTWDATPAPTVSRTSTPSGSSSGPTTERVYGSAVLLQRPTANCRSPDESARLPAARMEEDVR